MAAQRQRIMVAMGTRPEAIKLAPVVRALRERKDLQTIVVATAQHREMLDQALAVFHIRPDVDLDTMRRNQSLPGLTARILEAMSATLQRYRPHLLLVQGDTTTVFAAALAAFYEKTAVGHVEAGLRSHDPANPYPEEINRRLTSVLTELHFAPTSLAKNELVREGIDKEKIVVTGNTVVDALSTELSLPFSFAGTPLAAIPLHESKVIFVTSHRRESWGHDLADICWAIRDLVEEFEDIEVIYPVHPNPNVRLAVDELLSNRPRIHLVAPLDYLTCLNVMRHCFLILTDSGGIQEEAPTLHKPVLVLRQCTERPEAAAAGLAKIVGTSRQAIVSEARRLLTDSSAYHAMSSGHNPYGDGHAAERIARAIEHWLHGERPLLAPHHQFSPPSGQPWTAMSPG
jgi:UDP-N-acetylglucosamine 2-epimerase (non-hydrolysing)